MARGKVIGARVSEDTYNILQKLAAEIGVSVSDLVRAAVETYVLNIICRRHGDGHEPQG